MSVKVQSAV